MSTNTKYNFYWIQSLDIELPIIIIKTQKINNPDNIFGNQIRTLIFEMGDFESSIKYLRDGEKFNNEILDVFRSIENDDSALGISIQNRNGSHFANVI